MKSAKMWEGRLAGAADSAMDDLNASLYFDYRLFPEDIANSRAYALALRKAGILSDAECNKIRKALEAIDRGIEARTIKFSEKDEDIHMAIERLLTERIGRTGAKIHTGRSRNDQVATDVRLYVMTACKGLSELVLTLQKELLAAAEKHVETIMPGYTHLQQAQPVSLAHYLLSFFFALERDRRRLAQAADCADLMPLGAGALAGSGFALDRKLLARELGFSRISQNSIDAVSDRDFLLEFLSAGAILITHLSRYAEDFVIWSSSEFGFLEIGDAFSTGSSMMPQKKNPDSVELIRAKTGRVYGNLMRLLTVMKGIPLTYSRDLQEDKEALFDTVDTLDTVLPVMAGVVHTAKFKAPRMRAALSEMLLATDLADALTKNGLPFREAYKVVGRLSRVCADRGKTFTQLSNAELAAVSPRLSGALVKNLSFTKSLARRSISGGTAASSVRAQLRLAKSLVKGRKRD